MRPFHTPKILLGIALLGSLFFCETSVAQTTRLTLSENGLGPLAANTAFSVPRLQELLPGFSVVAATSSSEGVEFPTIKVWEGQTELFEVGPSEDRGRIWSFVVTSNRVAYSGGKIGSAYSEIFGSKTSDQCFPGNEELTGKVICWVSPTSHIAFLFVGKSAIENIPPIAVLKTMRVTEIWWRKER